MIVVDYENEIDSNSGDEIDDNDDSWNELESDGEPINCLFCDEICSSIEKAIEHLDQTHCISLIAVKEKFHLDQYSYIKVWLSRWKQFDLISINIFL